MLRQLSTSRLTRALRSAPQVASRSTAAEMSSSPILQGVGGSSAIREIPAPAYSTVNYIAGSNGNDNPFGGIVGLALDTNGNLFAADQSAAGSRAPTIWEVTKSSNYATAISINATTFRNPSGVALDSSNNLFVSDFNLNEVFELTAESTYGVVTQIASLNGNFNAPAGMAVDSSGDVFVADLNNNKVQEILKSGGYTTVNILSDTTLDMPNAIAIWPDGNIVVLNDKAPGVVNEIAAPEYTSVSTIDVTTNDPNYAALDTSGNLFITDTGDNLVKEVLLGVTVSSVSPIGGMTNGMTPVTITGTNFTSPATVNFGTAAATNVTVVSPTEITANSPAAGAGVVDVTVTTGVGTSFTSPSDHFSFGPTATTSISLKNLTRTQAASFLPVNAAGGVAPLSYSISSPLPSGLTISPSSGNISGTPSVTLSMTSFTVTVTDSLSNSAQASFNLVINSAVTAIQTSSPVSLTENHVANFTPVTGGGGTAPLSFSISPMLPAGLSLSPMTGAITGTTAATSPAVSYTVTVTDANGATGANTFSLLVNGAVTASPSIASEVLTQNHPAASFVPVKGGGGTGTLSYSISPLLPLGLSFNTSTGVVSGTPTATSAVTSYVVTVTDANGAAATAGFELMVCSAVTASQAVSAAFLTRGFAISPFTPVTGGGGTAPLLFNISPALPSGLSFNTSNGAISGTPAVESSATNYMITVTDTNGASASAGFSLTVNGPVTATQVVAFVGLTIDRATTPVRPVTGSGGTGTIHYSISPALPPGIALGSTTGQISGLPTITSASATYTVTVTDANGETASANFSLAVNPPVTATPAVASKVLTENQLPTSFTPVTGGGGKTPVSFSIAPALPAGLSFSTTTGAITGSPTATHGASSFSVTVTDANGDTASNSFSLTVNPAVTATQSIASEMLTENHAVTSFTPVMGGGGTTPLGFGI